MVTVVLLFVTNMKLTATKVKSLKPKEKPYKVAAGNGLVLLVNPNGSKWWRFNFRFEGKQKTISLGVYPKVSLADANTQTLHAKELLAQGINPSDLRKEEKSKSLNLKSFRNIAKQWHENKSTKWTKGHAEGVWRSLELNVFDHIGDDSIDTITPLRMIEVLRIIESRGSYEMVKKVRQRCKGIFLYAKVHGMILSNPCDGLEEVLKSHKQKNYNHITHKEIPELVKNIEYGQLEPTTKVGLMLALLTFQRTHEIRFARWDEIDFDNATWTIPAERMKMKREHVVPLSRQALEHLQMLYPITGQYPFIFASSHKPQKQPFSENAMLFALYRLGYRGRMTVHGFRHLASTTLNEMGFDGRYIEKQLSHEDKNTIRGTYNKAEYLAERTKMMQFWADFVDQTEDSNIFPIHSKLL